MANAENHSYPLEGFARSSREMPGGCYEEERRNEIEGAAAHDSLLGLIRNVMDDQEGGKKGIPPSKLRLAGLIRKTIATKRPAERKSEGNHRGAGKISRASSSFRGMLWGVLKPVVAKVIAYRPTAKHIVFAILALVVFFRPWLIPISIFALLLLLAIIWLSLGPDRISELVYGRWLGIQARNPERAEKIRHRFQAIVKRVNTVLSRVPGRWAVRLRLPDYSSDDQTQDQLREGPDPFEKLAAEARQEREQR